MRKLLQRLLSAPAVTPPRPAVRGQLETAQEGSELDFRASFYSSAVGQAQVDPDNGRYLRVNPKFCEISGYPEEELLRMTFTDLTHPDDRKDDTVAHQRMVRGETSELSREKRYLRKDGQTVWVDIHASIIRDDAGHPLRTLAVVQDITRRKQAEAAQRAAEERSEWLNAQLEKRVEERTAQLAAANKELEAFCYSVSHDLRAPLRTMDGFSQAVLEDYGPQLPAEGQRYLQTIRRGAQRMGNLIDDLLTFARLSRLPLSRRSIDATELVQEAWEDLAPQRHGRQVDFRLGKLPDFFGDRTLLKQVWINLLSNALKYTRHREPARVEVESDTREPAPVYILRDNGTGFDMRYVEKLFGVFQRLHRQEDFEGTGVGLAIVRRVIDRHGGRVWAEGEIDRGAIFRFTLPPEPEPPAHSP